MCYEGRDYTLKVKQRQKTTIELSLFIMSFIFDKCSIAQTTLTCSVVTLVLRSSQRREPTKAQRKACSDILFCTRSRTSGSSLVFTAFTLVRAISPHAATSRK